MYLIFSNNNKQYTIDKKKNIKIDFIKSKVGDNFKINNILYIKDKENSIIGSPYILNKEIICEVVKHIKDKKNTILKFKRRKNYLKKKGHRQKYTIIKLISIVNKEV